MNRLKLSLINLNGLELCLRWKLAESQLIDGRKGELCSESLFREKNLVGKFDWKRRR